ncbi:hypothetical protein AB0D08_25975 [Kitasatospora sp. NPDC048540]|uniref:hypothetical protein n=1 Tax=Kitasatospora sp. NPDC048540 TaxID=3155634 RepID=UPI0033F640A7
MSHPAPPAGPFEPLPVMDRQDAAGWARQLTEYLARSAGVALAPGSAGPSFRPCVGRGGEVAADGRYTLSYAVYSDVPAARHPEVVRRIRAALEQEGFEVGGYRETLAGRPDALLDAFRAEGRYLVGVESTVGAGRLLFRVVTRCLMPPAPGSG